MIIHRDAEQHAKNSPFPRSNQYYILANRRRVVNGKVLFNFFHHRWRIRTYSWTCIRSLKPSLAVIALPFGMPCVDNHLILFHGFKKRNAAGVVLRHVLGWRVVQYGEDRRQRTV